MKLILKNFRCYKSKEFEFDNSGLCLITAPSGSGKSTILMAINFVLYGKGNKVISYGESSCSVELIFNDKLRIKRSKKPNVLVVNGEYEDEVGQEKINKIFGSTFDITGYIPQNAFNSFILMNSSDKLQFLEKISFPDINLNDVKERVKNLINKEHDEMTKISGEISMFEKMMKEMIEPEEVKFPIKTKNEELSIRNEEIRLKNVSKRLENSNKEVNEYEKQLVDYRVLNSYMKSKKESLEKIINRILNLEEESCEYNYNDILNNYLHQLKKKKSKREMNGFKIQLEIDENKLFEMKKEEEENLKKELVDMTVKLWKEYSKEECMNLMNELKEAEKDGQKMMHLEERVGNEKIVDLEEMKNTITAVMKEIEEKSIEYEKIKKSQSLKECPSCKEKLVVNNDDELIVFDDKKISKHSKEDVDRYYKNLLTLKKKGKELETEFLRMKSVKESVNRMNEEILSIKEGYDEELNLEDIKENIEELQTYYKSQMIMEKKITAVKLKLKESRFSSSIEYLEKDIVKQREKMEEYEEEEEDMRGEEEEDMRGEEELQELISETKSKKENNIRMKVEMKNLVKEKDTTQNDIDEAENKFISNYDEIKTEEEIKVVISKLENEIEDYEKQKKIHEYNLDMIDKYKKYKKEKEVYDTWKKQMDVLKDKESLCGKRYSASLMLKQSILEAESIAVANIVNNINTNAIVFLDEFFQVNPIVVNIVCFKEVKNNSKPQLNVEVLYKDMMCDLTSLSGGELSRVILAFTLSLAEIFDTPLLLLDETTASLDEELTTIVFTTIKEHFRNIPILSISHQCTEGIFDKVVKL